MAKVIFDDPDLLLKEADYFPVDMHYHTDYSNDSVARINLVLEKAKRNGFGVAFTDHNEIKAAVKFFKNKAKVMVIPGIEAMCRDGAHMLYYFYDINEYKEFYEKEILPRKKQNPFFVSLKTHELIDIADRYNCVKAAPHPLMFGAVGIHKVYVPKKTLNKIDCAEVINSAILRKENQKAIKWANRIGKIPIGGSDGHTVAELGHCVTFAKNGYGVEDFLKSVLKGKVIVMGKEEELYDRMVVAYEKQKRYIKKAFEGGGAWKLVKSQLGKEFKYLERKIKRKIPGRQVTKI